MAFGSKQARAMAPVSNILPPRCRCGRVAVVNDHDTYRCGQCFYERVSTTLVRERDPARIALDGRASCYSRAT